MNRDSGDIAPSAFNMRSRDLKTGISVIVSDTAPSIEDVHRITGIQCFGVDRMPVESILALGLSVEQQTGHHAGIKGIPYITPDSSQDEREKAAELYDGLVMLCERVCRKR